MKKKIVEKQKNSSESWNVVGVNMETLYGLLICGHAQF